MNFSNEKAQVFAPDGKQAVPALARITDLCVAAHQDDIEIMAYAPIVACFDDPSRCFAGCVVTDGAGSPRTGVYADYSNEQMMRVRAEEQKNAARIGNYGAQVFLEHSSAHVKDPQNPSVVADIEALLLAAQPETVYTHNLADKHDTHVAVALRAIQALRSLPEDKRPARVYAMEVWRGLDWLCDEDKTVFDTSKHPNLAAALLGVFDSQIAGGKRYDSAALGRRLANATFFASHDTDDCKSVSYALDITQLVFDETITPADFIARYIERFAGEVASRIGKLMGESK